MTTRTKNKAAQPSKDKKVPAKSKKAPAAKKKTAKKQQKKAEPKSPGRKPWVPDYLKVEDWARQGLKDFEIAALCGVCKQTFCEKKDELPELVEALAKGRAKGTSMASNALWKNIAQGDTQAIKFYLERIAGWKQTNVIEKGKTVEDMTDAELRELLDRLEKEATA